MWIAADVSGAASTIPVMPKNAPAEIVTTRMRSGFIRSVAPIAIGETMFWSSPFARMTITSMISAVVVPGAEREQHGERAGDDRADERDVGGHEGDDRDRPRERHVEDQRADARRRRR